MRRSMILAGACSIVAVACLGGGGLFFVERPTIVRVAVPSENHGDYALLSAASKVVRHNHHPIRFKLVDTPDAQAASTALDGGKVDMAVVRTDAPMPADGQSVVILHRDAAILMVPHGGEIAEVTALPGHTVGIVGAIENQDLLDTILGQYDILATAVKRIRLNRDEVAQAVADRKVDAVLIIGILSSAPVQDTVRAVAKAGGGPPTFIGVPEAAAVAQRSPAYDSFEVVKGAFRGSPPLPSEEFDTLSVTHRLVASSELSERTVADVTRFFLAERSALVALDPLAQRIEAPSTDKGSPLPAHPGTAAYIDDEEESFLDAYSDYIYLAAMFFGVLASGAGALFSRLNAQGLQEAERSIERLVEIFKLVRQAPTLAAVQDLEGETDTLLAASLDRSFARGLDERCVATLRLAFDQVRGAVRDRRDALRMPDAATLPQDRPTLVQAR
ncbi:TAXI family TRAP transporter solute-binding subunit [Lichenihabitans sp. Uapishka_5]|uniref:TAXI family TRAP transporter solute-binding subunit n=1 Tax=Lichenihabitans sp. Uapishka_5 TaxID=3037302 RepID=UPI0029E80E49|nr:TAXI family TRAP transporter solute-binding subunit [Lichenihabitans sp. Uapishka_5]MDX7949958.1 TAXI family TRAP transporter solute-binding subunit [Lichenihabitans sp. Uapishka_5]